MLNEAGKLGSAVVVTPLYQPVRLISEIGMVDALTHGRLVLGVGSGYQPYEFERFGEDLEASENTVRDALERLARTEFETDAHRPFEEQRYDVLGSIRMNAQGLSRYWRKRWEREASSEAQPSAASRSAASNADGS